MKKIGIFLLSILIISGCGNPKLANGEEVIAQIDGFQISVDDVYKELKKIYGTNTVVTLIDNYIANEMIETTDDIIAEAESMIEMYKEQTGDQDWETLLLQSGFQNEEELKDMIINDKKKELALEKFVADNLSADDIEEYYENDFHGLMDVRHILIRPDETMEDQEEANEKAFAEAEELIAKLDDGADFIELVNEYSHDNAMDNDGLISNVNKEEYVEEFFYASRDLEVDEYTSEPVQTQFGYHIILKIHQDEKPSLEDARDEIKSILAQKTINSSEEMQQTLWADLRREHNFEILDTDIRAIYNRSFLDTE